MHDEEKTDRCPMNPRANAPLPDSAAQFATTHWTVVLASQSSSPQANQALERLCRSYWPPLYAYVRRRGYHPEVAQDLTQEFFSRLLQRNDLAQVKPELGRFRSFLLASMKHFLANEWYSAQTQKRGGGQARLSWDETVERQYQLEAAEQTTPETLFEKRWALNVLEQALTQLGQEYARAGKRDLFEALKVFLSGDKKLIPQEEIAARLGISLNAFRVALHRLRQRYGEALRDQIAGTVSCPAEIEEEIRYLMSVLGR
jgi:RNA polymerase sigma-70 factor (ECF subfamily)